MDFIFEKTITALVVLSVVSVFAAVFIDFQKFEHKNDVRKSKHSLVATGTMVSFFVVYFILLRFKIGAMQIRNDAVIAAGTAMVVSGAVCNILGRLTLKGNWANHIKIYSDHRLITTGIYRVVRHPLYASIILMLFGGCFVYRNWLCMLLTALIFVPFMYYRAKQEEALLETVFSEYDKYKEKTGMFFPKFWR